MVSGTLNSTSFLFLKVFHLLKNPLSVDASKIIIDVDVTSMSSATIVQNGLEDKMGYRYCCWISLCSLQSSCICLLTQHRMKFNIIAKEEVLIISI